MRQKAPVAAMSGMANTYVSLNNVITTALFRKTFSNNKDTH